MGECGSKEVSSNGESSQSSDTSDTSGHRILLLGSEASGKTTFCKQAVNRYMNGFTMSQRMGAGYTLQSNIVHRVNSVCGLVDIIEPECIAAKEELQTVSQCEFEYIRESSTGSPLFVPEVGQHIIKLIGSSALQKYKEENFFRAPWDYRFLNVTDIERIFADDYVPTDSDICWCRKPTTNSLYQYDLQCAKGVATLVDVGGIRQERSRWTTQIEQASAVLYLISLTDYANHKISHNDHFAYVSNDVAVEHRFIEDIQLLVQLLARFPEEKQLVIVLSKMDLMKKMIESGVPHMKESLPDYDGPNGDYEAAVAFLKKKIKELAVELCGTGVEKRLSMKTMSLVEESEKNFVEMDAVLNGFIDGTYKQTVKEEEVTS